ncbi:hypothetical protein ACPPVU_08820 [Mucilaginibacter sp. McL0603]|uniref:hypothetical protein n=1 Tax=Mucilaginibacter sp. McL0603 TaxID=3415670 RepID=UPI003CF0B863
MKTTFTKLMPEELHNVCPVHHVRPFINTDTDHINIRCHCDSLTDKYLLTVVDKIKGKTLTQIIDSWEADLLLNEAANEAGRFLS